MNHIKLFNLLLSCTLLNSNLYAQEKVANKNSTWQQNLTIAKGLSPHHIPKDVYEKLSSRLFQNKTRAFSLVDPTRNALVGKTLDAAIHAPVALVRGTGEATYKSMHRIGHTVANLSSNAYNAIKISKKTNSKSSTN